MCMHLVADGACLVSVQVDTLHHVTRLTAGYEELTSSSLYAPHHLDVSQTSPFFI